MLFPMVMERQQIFVIIKDNLADSDVEALKIPV